MNAKGMKLVNFLILLFIFSSQLFVNKAFASWSCHSNSGDCFDKCEPYRQLSAPPSVYYAGITYKLMWLPPRGEWHKFFVSHYSGTGFYFGRVICDLFSIELGYEWNIDKPKSFVVPVNGFVLGVKNFGYVPTNGEPGFVGEIIPPGSVPPGPITIISKVRLKTGYIDVNNYIPIFTPDFCFNQMFKPNIILSAGVANVRPMFHIQVIPQSIFPIDTITFIQAKTKAVLRLGVGFQAYFYKNFGLRVIGRWQGTSALRGRGPITGEPRNRDILGNDKSIYIGLYFAFPDPVENW